MSSSSSSGPTLRDWRDDVVTWMQDKMKNEVTPKLLSKSGNFAANEAEQEYFEGTGQHLSPSQMDAIRSNLKDILASVISDGLDAKILDALDQSNPTWDVPVTTAPTGARVEEQPSVSLDFGPVTIKPGKTWEDYAGDLVNGYFSNINSVNDLAPSFSYENNDFKLKLGNVTDEFNSALDANSFSAPEGTALYGGWLSVDF